MIAKVINFIKTDIWRIRTKNLSKTKSILLKPLMIIILALRSFDEDKCQLRASALTFFSLLSIVPIMAMAFGIAKGFGFEKVLETIMLEKFSGQEEFITRVIGFAQVLLDNTQGGMIAGIGVAVLFWTVIKVLGNIEKSFNDIWGIKTSRSMGRKFSDYLSIMLICPLLFIISSSVTVLIASQIRLIVEKIAFLGVFSPLILLSLKILPFIVIWVLFSFIYVFMPNTKVYLKSAFVGGIVGGTLFQIMQWAYIAFQVGVAKYNAIYGSFAALPLFLVWMQISWLIVLFGAEISFACQNLETYEFEPDCLSVSYSYKQLLTINIAHLIFNSFSAGGKIWTAAAISHELEIPIRLIRQILFELVEANVLIETKELAGAGLGYQPAHSPENITIKDIIDKLEHKGTDNIPVVQNSTFKTIKESLLAMDKSLSKSVANLKINEIK
ncbi:MAG: YihY family inner membrane protein [Candidatus Omnitrophica bacterium]|nr:YihY family inner membrane protein [Candidatus Omnitrophota bacterium]